MNKPLLKWSPAVPIRVKDNLISSAAREKNQSGFTPSYENESKQYMNFLMSNEYMRIWFKERGKYEKDIYSREQTIKEESKIKRRVVQRMMTYKKPLRGDFIDDMIQKKAKKPVPETPEKVLEKMKFRPDCHHRKKETESKNATSSGAPNAPPGASPSKGKSKPKAKEKTKKGTAEDDDECGDTGEIVVLCAETGNNESGKDDCKDEDNNDECCEDCK